MVNGKRQIVEAVEIVETVKVVKVVPIAADLRPFDKLRAGKLRSGKAAPTVESLSSALFD